MSSTRLRRPNSTDPGQAIVDRDIKPDNVMLRKGSLRLVSPHRTCWVKVDDREGKQAELEAWRKRVAGGQS